MKIKLILPVVCIALLTACNNSSDKKDTTPVVLMDEIRVLKEQVIALNSKSGGGVGSSEVIAQLERDKYQKNYQIIIRGIEIINDLNTASREILNARSQNIFSKKITDINNIQSEALGFQLTEVILQSIRSNIEQLPVEKPQKDRLMSQVSNFMDVIKGVFPPVNIISNVLSAVSNFTIFKSKFIKISRNEDSISTESINPVSKEVLKKITEQLLPYIKFYDQLNTANLKYETALNLHIVQNKDYIESITVLSDGIKEIIDLDNSIIDQVNTLLETQKSGAPGFDFALKNSDEKIRKLVVACYSVFDLVDKYKKFTNDFINILIDYHNMNITILQSAKQLPIKDDMKIEQMIADLNSIRNGDPAKGLVSFEEIYKKRLGTILNKLKKMNDERYK